ncbi:HD domain-containing phosphohydrolase [Desulfovibrio psychrotolerans]|uniref:Phosphohydrolase n=1 Tax=Desulfovibrio psychrotolerans TaxID=415242 RepID=A0A7J0BV58_9BACT|nr:HD domain-containing phosphohydrolase [Desulfovibrio psychrotolerans]GFM37593.1 phosphohydrolase [Desulfovibrio psychrotolerans]
MSDKNNDIRNNTFPVSSGAGCTGLDSAGRHAPSDAEAMICSFLRVSDELNQLKDVDTILDRTLTEVRALANADAGSIFLVEDGRLRFSYVHNDTLFAKDATNAAVYSNFAVPITEASIVGYSALSGETLIIDDAYTLDPSLPFKFNPSYDKATGYKTTSILTIPLKIAQGKLVGVMQIINAKDTAGRSVPFDRTAQTYIPLFANNTAIAIERGIMTRELILRMMKMAELRDPTETGAHVQRVGAYCAEIYHRYALNKGVPVKELKRTKDLLRLAAMLHDVGKVGISDSILKKPGKLTGEEFDIIKLHTVYGARLFENSTSDLDAMCRDIALNHHEKWSGGGYPGFVDALFEGDPHLGTASKNGEEIPLAARICALADVYDALASPRSYKEPFPEDKVLDIIKKDTGTHFDPEVTEAFLQIHDVILAIRSKYQ